MAFCILTKHLSRRFWGLSIFFVLAGWDMDCIYIWDGILELERYPDNFMIAIFSRTVEFSIMSV